MAQKKQNTNDDKLPKDARIFMAGHRGMVGSALVRCLKKRGFNNIITRSHSELDLENQQDVDDFFAMQKIDAVFLAAAKVGGILANSINRGEFIYKNLMIQCNVIHSAYKSGVERLLFLGSSCIYPRKCPQPMKERHLLSGYLEPTNEPYAVAKIAGIKLCESYNRQYGTRYRSVMPTNLYGPNDYFDLQNSHVAAAMIRKFHLAKMALKGRLDMIEKDEKCFGTIPEHIRKDILGDDHRLDPAEVVVKLWGSGNPRREFLFVDDMAEACLFVMMMSDKEYRDMCSSQGPHGKDPDNLVSHVNVGCGVDMTIRQLSEKISKVVGYNGKIIWDPSKPDGMQQKLLDVSRLSTAGWRPNISFNDGIKQTYAWYTSTLSL